MINKIWECIRSKNTNYTPIWFMRQAGRYLPEFQEIRKKNLDFVKLCLNTDLSTKITLQPLKRYNLDAAIIFSDILMIPYALGQKIKFEKNFGPILSDFNLDDIIKQDEGSFVKKLIPIYKSIEKVKDKLNQKALIGFVGAPWTLLLYMINKQSPKRDFNINSLLKDKILVNKLLQKLQEFICLHINKQVNAGANVIQIFDSWAGLLPKNELSNYCYIPTLKIVEYTKSLKVPVICFPKGIKKNYSDFCSIVKPDCISLDYETDIKWAKNNLKNCAIQGGMNPKILLTDKENIKKNVEKYLNMFVDHPYIFNLGHGVLPETKPEIIEYVIKIVREKN